MRLILINGVYGAPEHFDALRAALPMELATEVFTFLREGDPDPDPSAAFGPMIERLDRLVQCAVIEAATSDAESPAPATPERPAVLGFSLGGALALEYALHHPERISALVLVNAFDRFSFATLEPGRLPPVWRVPVQIRHRSFFSRLVYRVSWLRRGLFHRDAPLDVIERGMRTATSTSLDDARFQLAHLGLPFPPGQAERLVQVAERLPVLLVSSRSDLVVPPSHTDRLAKAMPAARRLPPFEGGHAFFQHDGKALAKAVWEFLSETQITAASHAAAEAVGSEPSSKAEEIA